MSAQNTAAPADNRALAEDVYNLIMAEIEPELLLENIPVLEETYRGESQQDHEKRMKRYAAAYKKFDAELAVFMTDVDGRVRTAKRQSLKAKEAEARNADEDTLTSIASAFD